MSQCLATIGFAQRNNNQNVTTANNIFCETDVLHMLYFFYFKS